MLKEPEIKLEDCDINFYTIFNDCEEIQKAYDMYCAYHGYISPLNWAGDDDKTYNDLATRWWNKCTLQKREKLVKEEMENRARRIEKATEEQKKLKEILESINNYRAAKNCLGSDRTSYGETHEYWG